MQTALVTGSSRGIGHAIAERLTRDGFQVIPHSRRHADLRSPEAIAQFFRELAPRPLQILVNNAAVWHDTPLATAEIGTIDDILETNLRAPFLVTQHALPLLTNGARIINISSVAARSASASGRSVYAAAKAGLEAFTRNWALELAPRGILVNAIAPGYVSTDMTSAHFSDPAVLANAQARHPLGRLGTADDIADAVAFLCSDQAAFITGQILNVSGGFAI